MEPHWKELVPGDRYYVQVEGPFNEGDQKVLTFLYQPLIGPICISLYMTLKNQIGENRLTSEPTTHYYIMNLLDTNLADIYVARLKLEAIGLLETFVKNDEDYRTFIYVLKPPLAPNQFFTDGVLNIYLYQKIGREYYARLKSFFSDQDIPKEGFEKVTKEFQQVFHSATNYLPYQKDFFEDEQQKYFTKPTPKSLQIQPENFDYELLVEGLTRTMVPTDSFTKEVKDAILKLAFLYGIDPIQMKNIVLGAIDDDNQINIDQLRKGARDWYTIEHKNQLPKLVDRIQSPLYHSNIDEPKTKDERLIRYLETVSPRQLLEDLSDGSEPSQADLALIEDIMFQQKLNPGVVNVLIQYCLLKTDMKLSKSYVEKIASHWARKKIKTVQEAMELAKEEHRKYLEWQKNKKENKEGQRKAIRKEKIPKWFENREQVTENKEKITNFEEEKRKLEEELKKYKG